MALNVNDTNLKLLYGLDESGPTSVRANAAAANVTGSYDMYPKNASGAEGLPVVSDGLGGKAVNTDISPGGTFATTRRWLQTTDAATSLATHKANGAVQDPADWTTDGEGMTVGGRFYWPGFETGSGGGTDIHYLFMMESLTAELRAYGVTITPDSNTSPATGGKLRVECGSLSDLVDSSWTATGAPPTEYIDSATSWWRWIFRLRFNGTTVDAKVWLVKESDGTVYTFTLAGITQSTCAFTVGQKASADIAWCIGCPISASDRVSHYGYQDEFWYYNLPVSDADGDTLVEDGFSVPWVSPSYTYNGHDVKVAWTNEGGTFPVPRDLPVGVLDPYHAAGAWGTRLRLWYEGTRPSRPWALRRTEIQFDTQGPRSSQKNRSISYDNANMGLIRRNGQLPPGSVVDVRNVTFDGEGPRRRRGFKVRRDVDNSSEYSFNAFASFRSSDDELHRLYKVSDTLWGELGGGSTSLQTGWNRSITPSFGVLDDRLIILSPTKQALWRGNTDGVDSFGIAAPTTGSVASTTGTLIGDYYYAYTFYDPVTGDESAPKEVGTPGTLATEGAAISSMDNTPADTRFTQQRIYRTTDGGASPNYFFIATQALGTSYTDSGSVDGTQAIGKVGSDFLTGTPPDTWGGVTIHSERAFYFLGTTYPSRLYWGEANEVQRWWSDNFLTFEAPVKAAISYNQGLLVLTDRTVELVESDFVRDGNGTVNIRRTVLSRTVGCPGPNAVTDVAGVPFWIDRRGIFTMQGDNVIKVSRNIDNIFRYLNMGLAANFSVSYNHFREQVWFSVASAVMQDDSSRMQTTIVLQLGEGLKWTLHDMECTFASQFDDDLNGIRFGGIDHLGCFKEYESYEGDGIDDPSATTSCEGTIGSISTRTITPSGSSPGWTVDSLRGMGVVFRDVSTGTIYRSTIVSNTANDFTIVDTVPSALAAADEYEIGGIRAYLEFSEQNMGSSNRKTLRFLYHQFDDLTAGRFV